MWLSRWSPCCLPRREPALQSVLSSPARAFLLESQLLKLYPRCPSCQIPTANWSRRSPGPPAENSVLFRSPDPDSAGPQRGRLLAGCVRGGEFRGADGGDYQSGKGRKQAGAGQKTRPGLLVLGNLTSPAVGNTTHRQRPGICKIDLGRRFQLIH